MTLLQVRELKVHLPTPQGLARAVDGVDLALEEGDSLGVVGESGSGKTLLALSLLGLHPGGWRTLAPGSSIVFRGRELVGMPARELRKVRGGEIAMVFQEPMTSLNPVFTVGNQIREALGLHGGKGGGAGRRRTEELLQEVGIPEPRILSRAFPHQLSGGMRQRVMIAMALAGDPALLVADEPTTALDVTVQLQILELLARLQRERGMALLLISHDLSVVARVCHRVMVMYGGRVVETGTASAVLTRPHHPYARGLVGSRLSIRDRRATLRPIPGEVPEATQWPLGCRFHPRCPQLLDRCGSQEPELLALEAGAPEGGTGRCWLLQEGKEG